VTKYRKCRNCWGYIAPDEEVAWRGRGNPTHRDREICQLLSSDRNRTLEIDLPLPRVPAAAQHPVLD
jgi:hypothetical protein